MVQRCSGKKYKIRRTNLYLIPFLFKFLFEQILNQALKARYVLVLLFRKFLSLTCFSHEFLVQINKNVSFQHVDFLHLIRYGDVHCICLSVVNVYLGHYETESRLFSQFYLKFRYILKNFKSVHYCKTCNLLFYTSLTSVTFLRFTK